MSALPRQTVTRSYPDGSSLTTAATTAQSPLLDMLHGYPSVLRRSADPRHLRPGPRPAAHREARSPASRWASRPATRPPPTRGGRRSRRAAVGRSDPRCSATSRPPPGWPRRDDRARGRRSPSCRCASATT
jgi:hypothetical protein